MKPSKGMTPTARGVASGPKVADTKSRESARLIKKTNGDFSKKSSTSKDSKITKSSKALPPLDITKLESLSNPKWGSPDLSPGIENKLNVMGLNYKIRNLLISMNLCSIKSTSTVKLVFHRNCKGGLKN